MAAVAVERRLSAAACQTASRDAADLVDKEVEAVERRRKEGRRLKMTAVEGLLKGVATQTPTGQPLSNVAVGLEQPLGREVAKESALQLTCQVRRGESCWQQHLLLSSTGHKFLGPPSPSAPHNYDLGKKNRVTFRRQYLDKILIDFKKLHEV